MLGNLLVDGARFPVRRQANRFFAFDDGIDLRRIESPDGHVFLQFFNDSPGILADPGQDRQRWNLRRIDNHLAVCLQEAGIAGSFHFFKGNEDIRRAFADDGRVNFGAKADLRTDAAAALAHAVDFAVDFGHLDIVAMSDEAYGEDFAG